MIQSAKELFEYTVKNTYKKNTNVERTNYYKLWLYRDIIQYLTGSGLDTDATYKIQESYEE